VLISRREEHERLIATSSESFSVRGKIVATTLAGAVVDRASTTVKLRFCREI
jgi:hypothetical protein